MKIGFAVETHTAYVHDYCMKADFRSLIISTFLLLLAGRVFSDSDKDIQIDEYESWNYIRHPRMEKEDYLRQSVFAFQPGLEIITDLDDVKILLSGEEVGRTPWEQNNLESGQYQVRLIFRGFELNEFSVTVHNDRRTVVTAEIGKGTLILKDMPSGAVVEIDGKLYSGNEISLKAGKKRLRITAFGWETSESAIEIPPGGRVEWRYDGMQEAFKLEELKVVPKSLPSNDRRGFRISWSASSSGRVVFKILSPDNELITEIPVTISSTRNSIYWLPIRKNGSALTDGTYRIVAIDIDKNNAKDISRASLMIDSRFQREARLMLNTLPGLLYAPGSSMLSPGVWQIAMGAGADIDIGDSNLSSVFPVTVGFRISPSRRWEISAKFDVRVRNSFDTTSVYSSLSGSWRINSTTGPFKINLALLLSHDGFVSEFNRIPQKNFTMILPGLHFITPMELSFDSWHLILSPIISLTFIGSDNENWRLAGPVRSVQSIGLGVYHESEKYLVGISTALRGPDFPQGFVDLTLWSGLEGRFDLLGDASYLAVFTGVRYLNVDPAISIGIEMGLIG